MRKPSDTTLIRRSIRGDRGAFVALIRRHSQPLAALIRRHMDDLHHAEDVLQETLLQAWVGLSRLRDPHRFRAWIFQVARNRCRDFHKSAQRRHRPTDRDTLATYVNRMGRAARRTGDERGDVTSAMEEIPRTERKVAQLFYREGLTIAEIAKRTHAPAGTVKRRLHDARKHLRKALGVTRTREER